MGLVSVLGKLYTNALFVLLNSRRSNLRPDTTWVTGFWADGATHMSELHIEGGGTQKSNHIATRLDLEHDTHSGPSRVFVSGGLICMKFNLILAP